MKTLILLLIFSASSFAAYSQTDEEQVERACMNYIEGFYEGDVDKLKSCLQPSLNKFGFRKKDGKFGDPIPLSYEDALKMAERKKESGNVTSDKAPKIVEVLEVKEHIAVAKVTAVWGVDYMLLSKRTGEWMIEQVIWQGGE